MLFSLLISHCCCYCESLRMTFDLPDAMYGSEDIAISICLYVLISERVVSQGNEY